MRIISKKWTVFLAAAVLIPAAVHSAALSEENDGLIYLNSLRKQTGLPIFSCNTLLQKAALAHSEYMKENNVFGHTEDMSKPKATGVQPSDRMTHQKYDWSATGENISVTSGESDVRGSIDELFSAIYHRFDFLDFGFRDVGIGILHDTATDPDTSYYTYDMATPKGSAQPSTPKLVVWPPEGGRDIPPAFYEEIPDPLPNHSVSGYPVSVQFNPSTFSSAPSVRAFTLAKHGGGATVSLITHSDGSDIMNESNDPNNHFSSYEAAIFPEKHLEWGTCYDASLTYNDGSDQTLHWSFTTRSLAQYADWVYRIDDGNDHTYNIVSGRTYALYFVPQDAGDSFHGYSSSYSTDEPTISIVTQNVLSVKAEGLAGRQLSITTDQGQKITLTIASTDTAQVPKNDTSCGTNSHINDTNGTADCADLDGSSTATGGGTGGDTGGGTGGSTGGGTGGGCTYDPHRTGIDLMMVLMMLAAAVYPLTRRRIVGDQ